MRDPIVVSCPDLDPQHVVEVTVHNPSGHSLGSWPVKLYGTWVEVDMAPFESVDVLAVGEGTEGI